MLTGGASRRMGRDKALLEWQGAALAVRVAGVLADAGAAEVYCVGGDLHSLAALGLDVRPDRYPGEGPLGGIIAALGEAIEDEVVVLSCDLIHASALAVIEVRRALEEDAATDVAVPMAEQRRQYLCGAYRRRALDHWQAAFDAGERSVWRAAAGLVVAEVVGLDPKWLRDVDVPEDLPGGSG